MSYFKRTLLASAAALVATALFSASSAQATNIPINFNPPSYTSSTVDVPIDSQTQNCAGTPINLTGNTKVTTRTLVDSLGGVHILITDNYNGLTGTDALTGAPAYTASGLDIYSLNSAPSQFPTATTTVSAVYYKGVNSSYPNFYVLIFTNLVLTQDGIAVDVSKVQTSCGG